MVIALVEDDKGLREGLCELLSGAGYALRTAENLLETEGIDGADLWIIDVMLPDGSGLDLVIRLRKKDNTPLLILTALDGEDSVIEGLKAGADDYITKPFRARELLARVEANLRRALPDAWELTSGALSFSFPDERIRLNDEALELRPMERRLLRLLLESRGRLLTREHLLYQLWDSDGNYVDENTLSVLVSRLRKALGRFQGEDYIETVRGTGYRWKLPCWMGGART